MRKGEIADMPQDNNAIYDFKNIHTYLEYLLETKKKNNSQFSLRSWARHLGYNSPAYLSLVFSKERKVNISLIEKIKKTQKLSHRQWRHLKLLYLRSLHNDDLESELFLDLLNLNKPHQSNHISLDAFDVLSEWYYFTLIEVTKIKGFFINIPNIRKIFINKIEHESTILNALSFLERSKFLKKEGSRYIKASKGVGNIFSKIPSKTIQLFHHSMLDLAQTALKEQNLKERHFGASTFAIKKDFLDEALTIVERAHQEIQNLSSDQADYVYQFNTQLFKMTKKYLQDTNEQE